MIVANIASIKEKLPPNVQLVAVSKLQPPEAIMEAYATGQRHFGENRASEFLSKWAQLPKDIHWHFIGHLQTNKVKMVTGKANLIHSIDSERLLYAINQEAAKQGTLQKCLLEIHIAKEESKTGFLWEEVQKLVNDPQFHSLTSVTICGLMGMASFVSDIHQVRKEFQTLKCCFDHLKQTAFIDNPHFCHLSMGMSGDWPIAVEEGSTLIRIGSQIFDNND
ncbi:MAG: YggS family pyridoxal phosphate-dependent enzyme [Prevotellaceae bacterium]|jgi:pyridoxal phosphate enzyme (YggS family)|nr:YggS family pyridoxal phosphate-dependent enzyme [Prevotellaceae bacterium]